MENHFNVSGMPEVLNWASNLRKHGVSFEEAATALSDSMAAIGVDPDH
jgi:uncharacterized DUF497 family protein